MTRICPTCKKEFEITKWQKSKIYCQDICKPGFKPNFGKVEEIADILSELTGISSNKIQSYLMQLTGGDDEMIFEVGKGYFKKKFGVGKKGFKMADRKKLSEDILSIY